MIPPLTTEGVLPPGRHKSGVRDVYATFVQPFISHRRQTLFGEWQSYTQRLLATLQVTDVTQWIGGSFVTNKADPNDIDVVTFVPYTVYEPLEEVLTDFYSTVHLHERGMDAYLCPVYPTTHRQHQLYRRFRRDWQRLFTSQRSVNDKKGFLEITLFYGN